MKRTHEYTEFGLWVKMKLANTCRTQRELCDETGIKPGTMADVLVGRNNKPQHVASIRFVLEEKDGK